MSLFRATAIACGLATVATTLVVAAPAHATPANDYEMPFPCGQGWTGTTRSSHSPNPNAVDWNRVDDIYDPVVASAAGVVSVANATGTTGYGRWVKIDHPGGESTLYAHLSSVSVSVGQAVDQGVQIGTLGSTGNSSGPHLHFEERLGSSTVAPWFHGARFVFGSTQTSRNCVDVPLAGNFLAGPEADLATFRRGLQATFRVLRPNGTARTTKFGTGTDQPVVGDWDGDGRVNLGVRTPSTRTFALKTPAGTTSIALGVDGDSPVAGDWDGDGRWEVGVRRASTSTFYLRAADGRLQSVVLGNADDVAVTGDWDGDGTTDVGVYDVDDAEFTLRRVDGDGMVWTAVVPFGSPGDLPVTGDWDGNSRTDLGVWDPSTATFDQRRATAPTAARATVRTQQFGRTR